MTNLIVSWTAYERPDPETHKPGGTIGGLERDLDIFAAASASEEDVVVLTGTLPDERKPSITHRNGYQIRRVPWLSPLRIIHGRELLRDSGDLERYVRRLRPIVGEVAPEVITAFGLEGDADLSRALFAVRDSNAQRLVNIVDTEYVPDEVLCMPWDLQVHPDARSRNVARARGAVSPAYVADFGVDLLSLGPSRSANVIEERLRHLPEHVLYIPFLVADTAYERQTIRAVGEVRARYGVELCVVTPDTNRSANPARGERRLARLTREADRAEVPLHIVSPFEPHEVRCLYDRATAVATWGSGHSMPEAMTALTPVVVTSRAWGLPATGKVASDIHRAVGRETNYLHDVMERRAGIRDNRDGADEIVQAVRRARTEKLHGNVRRRRGHPHQLREFAGHPARNRQKLAISTGNLHQEPTYPGARVDLVVCPIVGDDVTAQNAIKMAERLGDVDCLIPCSTEEQMTAVVNALRYRDLSGVTVLDVSGFRHSDLLSTRLYDHPLAAEDRDLALKQTAVTAIARMVRHDTGLPRYQRILFVDDDVELDVSHVLLAAAFVGPEDNDFTVHIPVVEEPDNSIVVHLARELGLDVSVFVGGGAKIAHVSKLRLVPNIRYNEDLVAILDEIGSGRLATVGAARQLFGWATTSPERAAAQTWGDILVMAALEWMAIKKEEGTLHRRSWTEMSSAFLEEFRYKWLLALEQMLEEKVSASSADVQDLRKVAAIERAIEQARAFDPEAGVDYLTVYATASDNFESRMEEASTACTIVGAASELGMTARTAGHARTRGSVAEEHVARQVQAPFLVAPRFLSDSWFLAVPWGSATAISDACGAIAEKLGVPLETADVTMLGRLAYDVQLAHASRERELLAKWEARLGALPEVGVASRWLNLPELIAAGVRAPEHLEYQAAMTGAMESLGLDDFSLQMLRRVLEMSIVCSVAEQAAEDRIVWPTSDTQALSRALETPWAVSAQISNVMMHPLKDLPPLNQSLSAASLAMEEIRRALSELFIQRRVTALWTEGGQPHVPTHTMDECVLMARMLLGPTCHPEGDGWQLENARALTDLIDGFVESYALGGFHRSVHASRMMRVCVASPDRWRNQHGSNRTVVVRARGNQERDRL